jgi:hypothetical protein
MGEVDGAELRKEAYTMALYVSVCLLAALTAAADRNDHGQAKVIGIVWGTTIGLALAHWFAFRLSARLAGSGSVHRHDVLVSTAQLGGAAVVASLCTVPILILSPAAELDAVRLTLAGFIAVVGYQTARSSGSPVRRALLYAAGILVLAMAVAVTKNVLSGH